MANSLRFLLLLNASLFCFFLTAQPKYGVPGHGCHYSENFKYLPPLSDWEKNMTCGSNARSDSIDVLNYNVTLDLTTFSQQATSIVTASCEVAFASKIDGLEALPLDLLDMTVDSVTWQGFSIPFNYDGLLLDIPLPATLNENDLAQVTVYYHGHPSVSSGGFGGLAFEDGIAYNLGIGLGSNPYNFGRSWHPCFDNFVERATYDLNLVTNNGRKGYGIGEFLGETDLGNGVILRQYRMSKGLPTYLVGFAASNYVEVNQTHSGAYGDYPVLLVGKSGEVGDMNSAFTYLGDAIDAFEGWYGPYEWGQVGFVMTPVGAMEHASLIAYPNDYIQNGPNPLMNALMAHELGHHWWGNITTLSCPDNMWIKEGNAEYCAHLFTELAFGKDYFKDVVKDNHYDVLKTANLEDGGNNIPLSGIPYEYTYSQNTTYHKGASVMHNLRGYLGDSLFAQGMKSILQTYAFESVDAELFRDQLIASTGKSAELTSFFEDWIFAPGFASFELDSVKVMPSIFPEQWNATIYVQQKLRAAPHFHTNVPLEITFFDENWNTYTATFTASGEFTVTTVTVPFQPVWQILNDDNKLNLARMQDRTVVYEDGNLDLFYADLIQGKVLETPDSALVSIIHYWVAPDPPAPGTEGVTLSSTHYWRFGGIIPPGFKAKANLQYKGTSEYDLDYDLVHNGEDSLILVWRPNTKEPWAKYPYYKKLDLVNYIRIDTMLPGDYAFANGDLPLATAAFEATANVAVKVFPNPASESFTVEGLLPAASSVFVGLYDNMGRIIRQEKVEGKSDRLHHRMNVGDLPPGIYCVRVSDAEGKFVTVERVVKD